MLTNKLHVNAALHETVTAFDPQLPMGYDFFGGPIIPPSIEFIKTNLAILRFYAPNAKSVAVRLGYSEGEKVELEKQQDGVWTASLDGEKTKYLALFFEVDGVYVLNPMAPIGWSHCHPINFIDFPNENGDYYLLKDVPHGTVTQDYYFSKTCGCFKSCLVYTPPDYTLGKWDNLPVLYLQHGYGENETSWVHLGKVNWIMDNLLAEGKAEPCIIVMNNGMTQTEQSDGSRNWVPLTIEKLLLDDCIPYIEKHYRVSSDKWRRAMAGLSMGSMQTSVITLNHPDLFGYAGIFSGFLGMLGNEPNARNDHFKAFEDKQKLFKSYKLFFRSIGDEDQYISQFNNESIMLKSNNLSPKEWTAHKETIYSGGHDWNVWRQSVKDFLELVFK